ncbi:MAG: hypothetical protein M0038_13725 [Pseudomonadota bacterium]|nr:hypothetical protein [Pseudomonadota bacterium]
MSRAALCRARASLALLLLLVASVASILPLTLLRCCTPATPREVMPALTADTSTSLSSGTYTVSWARCVRPEELHQPQCVAPFVTHTVVRPEWA